MEIIYYMNNIKTVRFTTKLGFSTDLKGNYNPQEILCIKKIYSEENIQFVTGELRKVKGKLVHLMYQKPGYDSYQIKGSVNLLPEDKQSLDDIFFPESTFGHLFNNLTFEPSQYKVILKVKDLSVDINYKNMDIKDLVKAVKDKYNTLSLLLPRVSNTNKLYIDSKWSNLI